MSKIKILFDMMLQDYNCGKHSGFPLCYNLCFSIGDNLSTLHKSRYFKYRRYINQFIEKYRDYNLLPNTGSKKSFNYIPCPFCLLFSNPIKVQKCKCHRNDEMTKIRIKYREISDKFSLDYTFTKNLQKIDKITEILFKE